MHPVMDTFPFFIYIIMCDHVVIFIFHPQLLLSAKTSKLVYTRMHVHASFQE